MAVRPALTHVYEVSAFPYTGPGGGTKLLTQESFVQGHRLPGV